MECIRVLENLCKGLGYWRERLFDYDMGFWNYGKGLGECVVGFGDSVTYFITVSIWQQ